MPRSSGPYTPAPGVPFNISNPAASGGNLVTSEAVVVNLSPYELDIAAAGGSTIALIDPFTRDGVPLAPTGQQLTITPVSIGFNPPAGIPPTVYVLWYGPQEQIPAALPAPVVPYGNLQQVNLVGYSRDVGITSADTRTALNGGVIAITPPAGYVNRLKRLFVNVASVPETVTMYGQNSGTVYDRIDLPGANTYYAGHDLWPIEVTEPLQLFDTNNNQQIKYSLTFRQLIAA